MTCHDMITSPRDPVYREKKKGPTTEPFGTAVCEETLVSPLLLMKKLIMV